MVRVAMIVFTAMTAGAGAMTYYNVGLEDKDLVAKSVRQGSQGSGITSGGGYRYGK